MSNYFSERVDGPNGDQNKGFETRSLKVYAFEPCSNNMELTHLAELIASGEASFPDGLMKNEEQKLLQAVQDCRRRRLVHYIAGAIAQDILRTRAQ